MAVDFIRLLERCYSVRSVLRTDLEGGERFVLYLLLCSYRAGEYNKFINLLYK